MLPRFITRTHYQVDEPAFLRVAISKCSSPTQSDYQERVADRLTKELKSRGEKFNPAAARYCIDMARALGLLTDNLFWTATAHSAALLSTADQDETPLIKELSIEEKFFWLRVFFERDAAALQFFAGKIAKQGQVPGSESDWNDLANEMTSFIYEGYLGLSEDIRDRAEIRQVLSRRQRQPYEGKSGPHQCFVHVNTLFRTGLLSATGRRYFRNKEGAQHAAIDRFVSMCPTIRALEDVLANSELALVIGEIFWGSLDASSWSDADVFGHVQEVYSRVLERGVSLCPLNTISHTLQVKQLSRRERPTTYDHLLAILRKEQSKAPKRLRFHVDRLGRPAFIVLA